MEDIKLKVDELLKQLEQSSGTCGEYKEILYRLKEELISLNEKLNREQLPEVKENIQANINYLEDAINIVKNAIRKSRKIIIEDIDSSDLS